jgi:hypothetical protein
LRMKHPVTLIKNLKTGLKEIERFIKQPALLWSGREPKNFKLRPREIVANWFISAVISYDRGGAEITFSTDPVDGDGIIVDKAAQANVMLTEHVFVGMNEAPKSLEPLIVNAIADKMKNGEAYSGGKTLIVFPEGSGGEWKPNRVARQIEGKHKFDGVWVVQLIGVKDGEYEYGVARLTMQTGNAPTWTIKLNSAFDDWTVAQIQ